MQLTRREMLRSGVTGLGAIVLGTMGKGLLPARVKAAAAPRDILHLTMREALVEMVDLTRTYMWLFDDGHAPRLPGPVIFATEGERVDIAVTNDLPIGEHSFVIPGVVDSRVIRRGTTRLLKFNAPSAGTYIYLDPLSDPINRVMGLHGVLVSMPRAGHTPYTHPTPQVKALFHDLGTHPVFPGHRWHPHATVIWVFHQIDPGLNEKVRNGTMSDPDEFARRFQPRYFTINGRSGYFSAHDGGDSHLDSTVGHPHLIRNVNTGLWGQSPHTHANHCYALAVNGQVLDNVMLLDTWTIKPMDRKDMLFPFVVPPDIPPQAWQKVIDGVQEEPFPMDYPMHCHQEVSNTAAGGNYPQGNVTHIIFRGPLDTQAAPGNPPPGYPPQPDFDLHTGHPPSSGPPEDPEPPPHTH